MKDAVATMGGLLPDDAGGRDAVHVAVFSATSDENLSPCQPVTLRSQADRDAKVCSAAGESVGVVDPFLKGIAPAGSRFWVYLYPRTITGLAHQWTHPAFEQVETAYVRPNEKAQSEAWLRNFCDTNDCPGYHTVLGYIERIANGDTVGWDGEYIHCGDQDAHASIPDEFWGHAEIILGRPIKGERAKYFTCAC